MICDKVLYVSVLYVVKKKAIKHVQLWNHA